jgi:hypothetical protein
VDTESKIITVRDVKGSKDRVTMLPIAAVQSLIRHLEHMTRIHQKDLTDLDRSCFLMHSSGSIATPQRSRGGSGYSRRSTGGWIGEPASQTATMSTNLSSKKSRPTGCQDRRPSQARVVPHVPAFVRHAPTRGRIRHPDRPGAARAQGCEDHDDLHARPQSGTVGGSEPGRPLQPMTGYTDPRKALAPPREEVQLCAAAPLATSPQPVPSEVTRTWTCREASYADPYTYS